ncbi:prolipoprotein diacylglyceryl transferase, partial [Planctomycetota bacterium]
ALYSLMAGIVGARIFYVLHHWDEFKGNPLRVFALWEGGLEFLGGVVLAILIMMCYLRVVKLPVRRVMDLMAIGLMAALIFGRVGCLLNGCCWGKPTSLPWGIRFPYGSLAYHSQIEANPERGRMEPHLHVPDTFWGYDPNERVWRLKELKELSPEQRQAVLHGQYRCLPVHPSQIYASLSALGICAVLCVFWTWTVRPGPKTPRWEWLKAPGLTLSLMLILYGWVRYLLELSRDDNPFEIATLTISQIIGLGMVVMGLALVPIFIKLGPNPDT